jgi:hypothetical protein
VCAWVGTAAFCSCDLLLCGRYEGFRAFLRNAGARDVLTQPEFKKGLKSCGIPCTEAATQEIFALLDPNHDMCLDQARRSLSLSF